MGHWSTCEARMIMAYYRLGKYEDARRSMKKLLTFARAFRMDNPLTDFGNAVYQPKEPINLTYDAFGPAAAIIRGLFEYLYHADGLTLIPHVPPGITELEQLDPIRFGEKKLYLSTAGHGPITSVTVNGRPWKSFDAGSVFPPYERTPDAARISISFEDGKPTSIPLARTESTRKEASEQVANEEVQSRLATLDARAETLRVFRNRLLAAGLGGTYEAAHAQLVLDAVRVIHERLELLRTGKLAPLPAASQAAAARPTKALRPNSSRVWKPSSNPTKVRTILSGGKSLGFVPKATRRSDQQRGIPHLEECGRHQRKRVGLHLEHQPEERLPLLEVRHPPSAENPRSHRQHVIKREFRIARPPCQKGIQVPSNGENSYGGRCPQAWHLPPFDRAQRINRQSPSLHLLRFKVLIGRARCWRMPSASIADVRTATLSPNLSSPTPRARSILSMITSGGDTRTFSATTTRLMGGDPSLTGVTGRSIAIPGRLVSGYQVSKALQEYFRRVEQAPKIPPLNWLPGSFDPYGKIPYPFDANTEHPEVYSVIWYYGNIFVDPKTKQIVDVGRGHPCGRH